MASFYSVVQYLPDPVRNERVNVGVLAFGGGRLRSQFLTNWNRVKQFVGRDVSFLIELSRDARRWDEQTVRTLAGQWTGSIQLTEVAASVLDTDELLVDSVGRYLVE